MLENLKESLEEHKGNLETLDYLTIVSLKNLYSQLIHEVDEALKEDGV